MDRVFVAATHTSACCISFASTQTGKWLVVAASAVWRRPRASDFAGSPSGLRRCRTFRSCLLQRPLMATALFLNVRIVLSYLQLVSRNYSAFYSGPLPARIEAFQFLIEYMAHRTGSSICAFMREYGCSGSSHRCGALSIFLNNSLRRSTRVSKLETTTF